VRALAVVLLAAACAACSSAAAEPTAASPLQRELTGLVVRMERVHPDLYHAVTRERLRAEVAALAQRAPSLSRPELVVGLMRVVGLLGERDGHSGLYPLDPEHPRTLHAYPLKLYSFPDGLYVIDAADRTLVGARLATIEGVPAEEVVRRVRPLMTRDNESTIQMRLPGFVVGEEVLAGLGIGDGGPASFAFADGRAVTLRPTTAAAYVSRFGFEWQVSRPSGRQPLWLQRQDVPQWLRTIDRGRAVYLGYHHVTGGAYTTAERLVRLAGRPQVRRVVVDVRMNGGGDNTTYGPLVEALRRPAIGRKAVVLTGRVTFSAAANFVAEVEGRTRARLIGEPTGGAPNQWGDNTVLELPVAGLALRLANQYVVVTDEKDVRVTIQPDVQVELTAADFFAGRDPVLARALSR
jgi:Peptidase family S41